MSSDSGSESGRSDTDAAPAAEAAYVPAISPPSRVTIVETLKRIDLKDKEYTAYRMKVLRLNGEVNVIDQRYQFFHDLNESLLAAGLVPEGAELPGKKWFSNFDPNFVEERRRGLQNYLERVLASPTTRNSPEIEKFFDAPGRYDWPSKLAAVDLDVHDGPHLSSATETWRFRANVLIDGAEHSMFVCFLRTVSSVDPETQKPSYVHAVASALIDIEAGTYHAATVFDPQAPAMLRDQLARTTFRDHTVVAAYQETLAKGLLPLPDRLAESAKGGECDPRKLRFMMDGNKLERQSDGSYSVTVRQPSGRGCELQFNPTKPPVRHGEMGVLLSDEGEQMYSYFIPRCSVTGSFTLEPGGSAIRAEASSDHSGWYEHQFGGKPLEESEVAEDLGVGMTPRGTHMQPRGYAMHSCDVQLEEDVDVAVSLTFDMGSGAVVDGSCVVVNSKGDRTYYDGECLLFEGSENWQSTRTFQEFPTRWFLSVPEAELSLTMRAAFDDQEFITLLSQPSLWEGKVLVEGERAGRDVSGTGFVQRRGYGALSSLEQFFHVVGDVVRSRANMLLPDSITPKQARKLLGASTTDLDGLPLAALDTAIVQPIRSLTNCGGQAWRSFAMLAACEAVGGDSRELLEWIALPELLHVGCTMVGAENQSDVIAGSACFTLAQRLLDRVDVPDHAKIDLYDQYFASVRSAQVGQGVENGDGVGGGCMALLKRAVGDGNIDQLEAALLSIYRLKSATPAAALVTMGAIGGAGEAGYIEALGEFAHKTGLGFQLASDVESLQSAGTPTRCVTMPVVKAIGKCKTRGERQAIVDALCNRRGDLVALVEQAGGCAACMAAAIGLVEDAWKSIASPAILPDSYHKIMLRALSLHLVQ